jgi:hypothetical protein
MPPPPLRGDDATALGRVPKGSKPFFFEKKNQKTFIRLLDVDRGAKG